VTSFFEQVTMVMDELARSAGTRLLQGMQHGTRCAANAAPFALALDP
jgi:hypothetical protein